ncbi:MAG: TIGR03915 family putative DNA repair protein [Acetivibrionales bacterium]|jgi:probable DNA metabolism protein|nr:DNA metabolism protein [Clostridiaceae bacterium]
MIYVTDGSFEGILSAIFEAYENKEIPESIVSRDFYQISLDTDVKEIHTNEEKSGRVYNAIIEKMSHEALETIYKAWLSEHYEVGTALYKYVKIGLKIGKKVLSYLQNPDVLLVNDLAHKVAFESHRFLGILRFKKLKNGLYYSRIEPDNNITMLIAEHFAQRMSDQSWIIHDAKRNVYALYDTNEIVFTNEEIPITSDGIVDTMFEQLWKNYFKTIAIESRKNPRLQRQYMPRRYWKNLTEVK